MRNFGNFFNFIIIFYIHQDFLTAVFILAMWDLAYYNFFLWVFKKNVTLYPASHEKNNNSTIYSLVINFVFEYKILPQSKIAERDQFDRNLREGTILPQQILHGRVLVEHRVPGL